MALPFFQRLNHSFVAQDEKGKLVARARVETTEGNLLRFVRSLKGKGTRKLVYEEMNLSKWFHCVFKNEVEEQIVCDPYYLGEKQGPKDDDKDAWHLSNELRCNHIVPVYHEQNEFMDMRALTGAYLDLNRQITQTKNRYKALFRSQGIKTQGQSIYNEPEKIKKLTSQADRFVAENLLVNLDFLLRTKQKYLLRFKRNREKYALLRKLDTVPGFDLVRSHIVAALVCSPQRFRNKHKFWAYAMLVRYIESSDDRFYGMRNVRGRRELKGVFDGATETVLRGNSSLRKFYDRLRSKGLDHKRAKKAVSRKMAAICLSILKHNTKYDDKHEDKQRRLQKKSV